MVALALMFSMGGGVATAQNPTRCTAQQGQVYIDTGRYDRAIREFSCVIDADPTAIEGYRGRIEAELLLGKYSDAVITYTRLTADVIPVHPDASTVILAGYADRLAAKPNDIPALTGSSFARWWFFQYAQAIQVLNKLLSVRPNDIYGNLFRGSTRLLQGRNTSQGIVDLDRAIAFDPENPHVRYIAADAYTYGLPDPARALAEGTAALDGGLDTPRVHAILASAYFAFGDDLSASAHLARHIELVTTQLLFAGPLASGESATLDLVPGRTYEIPVDVALGQTLSIVTSSHDIGDSIMVLLAPDGTPVFGNDDFKKYLAGFDWVATGTGTYRVQVTSFDGVSAGTLVVTRN
jgi:tetratricopeptide (TPR) repeat protein